MDSGIEADQFSVISVLIVFNFFLGSLRKLSTFRDATTGVPVK